MVWGWELVVDLKGCDKAFITDSKRIKEFVAELVESIDMKAYGKPLLKDFANHDPTKGGYTLVQMIETSSITGHFVSATGDAYLNIFSCKHFDMTVAMNVIKKYFKPEDHRFSMLNRGYFG